MTYIEDADGIWCNVVTLQNNYVHSVHRQRMSSLLKMAFMIQQWRLLFTVATTASLWGTESALIMSPYVSQDESLTDWLCLKCSFVLPNKQTNKKATNWTSKALALVAILTNEILLQECCGHLNRSGKVRDKQTAVWMAWCWDATWTDFSATLTYISTLIFIGIKVGTGGIILLKKNSAIQHF